MRQGSRKFALGLVYLIGSYGLAFAAILTGASGWDAAALASFPVSIATGLGAIVWGNAQEHRARNGHGAGGAP